MDNCEGWQIGNRRVDYGEACKHEIGGWIMMKPGNMEWRVDYEGAWCNAAFWGGL